MMIDRFEWHAIMLTLALAAITTAILLVIGTPLAWWLARGRSWGRSLVSPLVAMPLVLPPTVLGFYLLILLGPNGPLGRASMAMGWGPLAFTFPGLVIGSVVYSMPFVVQPLQNAFQLLGDGVLETASTLRASPLDRFFSVVIPLARPGFICAAILGFAHTLGEFGVVLMIGGNIPGHTQVISTAIYNHVEAMNYSQAHLLAGGMLLFSFVLLALVGRYSRGIREIAA